MGSSILSGKTAAAFQAADGTSYYCLFERRHESNCYPHIPSWSAIAFGRYEDVLKCVFDKATSCESGMLRSRSGPILGENYIRSWKRAIARPCTMPNVEIKLHAINNDLYEAVPLSAAAKLENTLRLLGKAALFQQIFDRGLDVSLHEDAALLSEIYGIGGVLPPWRLLNHGDVHATLHLATPNRCILPITPAPQAIALKVDDTNFIVRIGQGPWTHAGWLYCIVSRFINEVAFVKELADDGSGVQAISQFRDHCKNADKVPDDVMIAISRHSSTGGDWHSENADKIAVSLGMANSCGQAPSTFTCRLGDIRQADQREVFAYLAPDQVEWRIPFAKGLPDALLETGLDLTREGATREQIPLFQ